MKLYENHTIVSVTLLDDGGLEVIRRFPSNQMLLSYPPRPASDRMLKETYRAGDDLRIHLAQEVEGTHTPSYVVPESIDFKT